MIQTMAILAGLIMSTTCSVHHPQPIQLQLIPIQTHQQLQEVHIPNYSFSYDVNDGHTGDVKHQQETRHGGTVTGQYSLLQPDGIRRTVDYRADDASGFHAIINNRGNLNRQSENDRQDETPQRQIQPQNVQNASPTPMAISRSSIVQNIQNHRIQGHNWE